MYGLTEKNCQIWHGYSYLTWEDLRCLSQCLGPGCSRIKSSKRHPVKLEGSSIYYHLFCHNTVALLFYIPWVSQAVPLKITHNSDPWESRRFCQDFSSVRILRVAICCRGGRNFQYMHVTYNSVLQELQHFPSKYLVPAAHSLALISNPLYSGITNNFRKLGQCGI